MRILSLLVLTALAAPSSLDAQTPPQNQAPLRTFESTLGTHQSIGRCVIAGLSAFGPDVVYLADGEIWIVVAPAVHNTVVPLVHGSTAVLDLTATDDGQVLFVDAAGLHQLSIDSQGAAVVQTLATGSWAGATRVLAADTDNDTVADAIGIAGDGVTLLHYGGASGLSTTRTMASTIRSLVAVEWDIVAGDEIAVATTTEILLLPGSITASAVFSTPYTGQAVHMQRIVTPIAEFVAGTMDIDAGGTTYAWCFTLDRLNGFSGATILRADTTRASAGGDFNRDGNTDLLIGFAQTPVFDVYYNTTPFIPDPLDFMVSSNPTISTELTVPNDPPATTTVPAVGVLWDDGTAQMAYGSVNGRIAVLNSLEDPAGTGPSIPNGTRQEIASNTEITIVTGDTDPSLPIELELWRINDSGGTGIDPVAHGKYGPTSTSPFEFKFQLPTSDLLTKGYYGVLRQLEDGRPKPAKLFILAKRASPTWVWAENQPHSDQPVVLEDLLGNGGFEIDIIPIVDPPAANPAQTPTNPN